MTWAADPRVVLSLKQLFWTYSVMVTNNRGFTLLCHQHLPEKDPDKSLCQLSVYMQQVHTPFKIPLSQRGSDSFPRRDAASDGKAECF